jgi:hypothetical protein
MYRKNRDPRREERLKIAGVNFWRLLGSVCGIGSAHKIQVARALSWEEPGEARKKKQMSRPRQSGCALAAPVRLASRSSD